MSPFKRTARAAAKQRAGRHRKPEAQAQGQGPLPPVVWPQVRASFSRTPGNAEGFYAELPPELASREYDFPHVPLPDTRPLVTPGELIAALDEDAVAPLEDYDPQLDETQPIDMRPVLAGKVLDEQPQPAQHEGLAPAAAPSIPVPSVPFLNAGAPQPEAADEAPTRAIVRVGNALPARLTAPELMLLGRPVPADAPPAVRPAPATPGPQRRDSAHQFTFGAFDDEFWELVTTEMRQQQAGPGGLRMSTDAAMDALDKHLAAVDAAHRAQVERGTGMEYGVWLSSQLTDASRPLPRRTPGTALAAAEASRGELVAR